MREVYRSTRYAPEDVARKYARYYPWHESYRVYEVDGKNRTIREYDTDGAELPETVRRVALERSDLCFGAVEWN